MTYAFKDCYGFSEERVWEKWNNGEASAMWCANQLNISLKEFYELLDEKGQPYELLL